MSKYSTARLVLGCLAPLSIAVQCLLVSCSSQPASVIPEVPAQAGAEAQIREVVSQFTAALNAHDNGTARALGSSRVGFGFQLNLYWIWQQDEWSFGRDALGLKLDRIFEFFSTPQFASRVDSVTVEGRAAAAEGSFTFSSEYTDSFGGVSRLESEAAKVTLVIEDGHWRVVEFGTDRW